MNASIARPNRRSVLALAAAAAWPLAQAQTYPNRPIRLVVPSPAGSLPDVMARLYADDMKNDLGQPLVIENKPGAGGGIAAEFVARSAPDGYTLLLATDAILAINPLIYRKLAYDPQRDFKPVSLLARTGGVIVANPKLGVKTMPELVRLSQLKPDLVRYGSGGNGHATHFAMELLKSASGMKAMHVPYRGTPQAIQDLIAGEIGVMYVGYVEAMPHVKSGALVALASTGQAAKTIVPDIPELKEYYPNMIFEAWFALVAPAQTPDAIIRRFNALIAKANQSPAVKGKLFDFGVVTSSSEPAAVSALMRSNLDEYAPIVKAIGMTVD